MTRETLHNLAVRLGTYKRHAEIHPAMERITVGEFLDVVLYAQQLGQRLDAADRIVEYVSRQSFHVDTELEDLLMAYDDQFIYDGDGN